MFHFWIGNIGIWARFISRLPAGNGENYRQTWCWWHLAPGVARLPKDRRKPLQIAWSCKGNCRLERGGCIMQVRSGIQVFNRVSSRLVELAPITNKSRGLCNGIEKLHSKTAVAISFTKAPTGMKVNSSGPVVVKWLAKTRDGWLGMSAVLAMNHSDICSTHVIPEKWKIPFLPLFDSALQIARFEKWIRYLGSASSDLSDEKCWFVDPYCNCLPLKGGPARWPGPRSSNQHFEYFLGNFLFIDHSMRIPNIEFIFLFFHVIWRALHKNWKGKRRKRRSFPPFRKTKH